MLSNTPAIPAHLFDRNTPIHDFNRHESLYQRSGLLHYRHAVCGNRSRCKIWFWIRFLYLDLILASKEQLLLRSSHKYCLLSMCFTFLGKRLSLKVRLMTLSEFSENTRYAKDIISLGTSGCVMQLTNSLVSICCNNVLSVTGGDLYISVMTIVSSIRQMVGTPIYAIVEGSSPVLSYNYGARRPARVRKSIFTMGLLVLLYTAVMWSVTTRSSCPDCYIFSSDATLMDDAVKALNIYFAAFIFMDLQYIGQTTFKSH